MKKNKTGNHQKRIETKRTNRNKRKNRKKNEPKIEWITDTMFSVHFDNKRIHNLFPSITIEIVKHDDDCDEDDEQALKDHIQSEIDEINQIYADTLDITDMN